MAGDPKYGASSAGFQDAIARMGAQEAALGDLAKKEADLRAAEAESSKAQGANVGTRGKSVEAIRAQASALNELATVLGRENTLLGANTTAWRANAKARESSAAAGVAGAPTAGGRYGATTVGFSDTIAATNAEARAVQDLEAKTAQLARTRADAIRTLSSQGIPPNLYRGPQVALPAGDPQRLLPEPLHARPYGAPGTYLGQGESIALGQRGIGGPFVAGPGGLPGAARYRQDFAGETAPIGKYTAAEEQLVGTQGRVRSSILGVAGAQREANAAFNLSVAEYAASSQALQRHGALSTEFIQGLARGEVTLAEFGSALTSTIGKFAGWAVAGGLVYGAFEALKRVTEGATAAASGVAKLERAGFHVNRAEAEEGFAAASKRINVPIHQVAEAQFYAARAGFHSQPESLAAGETALLAEKLDQLPVQDAAKSLGALKVAFHLTAGEIRSVFNELDVGQLRFNARLNQTLPQAGRAASAFANAGGTVQQLVRQLVEVTGQTGGGGGQGGGNPATLFIREASNLAKPGAIETLRRYGFNPNEAITKIGNFNEQLQRRAAIPEGRPGYLSDSAIRELAKAIGGGGAVGGRYGIALIQQGRTNRDLEVASGLAKAGPSAQEDLSHTLKQFDEQVSAIGHTFERVGLALGRSGVTKVAEDFISVLRLLSTGIEKAAKPLATIGNAIGSIPAPLQDLLAAGALGVAGTRFARSGAGIGLSRAAGEVPGLGFLNSEDKQTLRGLQRTTSEGLDYTRRQGAQRSGQFLDAGAQYREAVAEHGRFAASEGGRAAAALNPLDQSEEAQELRKRAAGYQGQTDAARERFFRSERALLSTRELEADFESKKAGLKDKHLSVNERVKRAAAEDLVLAQSSRPDLPLQSGSGLVGTAAAARGNISKGGVILPETVAVKEGLDQAGVAAREGGVKVEASLASVGLQARAGGRAIYEGLLAAALAARAGGAAEGLATARGGAGQLFDATALGSGKLLSKVGANLSKAFFAAYTGSLIAEIAGPAIGEGVFHSKKAGSALASIGGDIAIGAGLGALIPIPGVGPVVGGIAGGIFGAASQLGGGTKADTADALTARVKLAEHRARNAPGLLGGKENYSEHLETVAEGYGEELEVAFKDEGEGAQKAKANLEKRLRVVAATLKLFGQSSQRGRAVQDELEASYSKSVEYLLKNPSQIDQGVALVEKQQEVSLKQSKAEFDQTLKHARSPAAVEAAQQKLEGTNQGLYQTGAPTIEKHLTDQLELARKQRNVNQDALAKLGGPGEHTAAAADARKKLNNSIKEVESYERTMKEFHELAPRLYEKLNEQNDEAAEATYKKLNELQAAPNQLKLAEAGANAGARDKEEARIEAEQERNARTAFKGKPDQERKAREEIAAARVQREQRKATERLENAELEGARQLAELPIGATKVAAADIRVSTDRARLAIIKKNHDNAFSHKQLVEAETKLIEAEKARQEAIQQEATELISLHGQITQALESGNAIAQAGSALSTAGQLLALAKSPKERLQGQLGVINAQNQLRKAQQDQIKRQGEYEQSLTSDPLAKERIALQTDRRLLSAAQGPDERQAAQTTLNNALRTYTASVVSNKEQDIEFHKQLGQTSNQAAIEQYQSLLKLHGLTKRERQDILLKIHGLQNELGVGNNQVFNLSPGNIKLPTAVDVRRAISAASGAGQIIHSATENHNQVNHFNITVHDGKDVGKVADALDRALHGGVKARLRAAGYRGH